MMQGPHGYSPVQQLATVGIALRSITTSYDISQATFEIVWHMFFMFALTSYDSPPGKQVPRNLGICSPGRTPYVERRDRDMERLNGAKAVSTQDLETWRLGQPMSTENHCFPCAVEVWAHGSTATRTLSDLKLCLSCFFPPCSVGFLGSQM